MHPVSRRTLRNGVIGGVVGTALGLVPIVLLVAPLFGGGVAGYLERDGPSRGALAGVIAGVLMAMLGTAMTAVALFVRFGDLSGVSPPLRSLGIAALLSIAATVTQVLVAGFGGALGALLSAGRQPSGRGTTGRDSLAAYSRNRTRPWIGVVGSLVAGVVAFLVVAVALTAVLDPFIWPSLLVGLPVGFVAGAAVAVLGYRYITRGTNSALNWRAIGAGVVVVLIAFGVVVAGLSVLGQDRREQTRQSTYDYQVTVSADRSLEDVTFYVPAPTDQVDAERNATDLGERFVQDVRYNRDVPALSGYDPDPEPVNFSYELVDTAHGRMVAITADRIEVSHVYYHEVENETMGWRERIEPDEYDPTDPTMGVLNDGHFTFSVTLVADEPIETADPFETEPLLEPRYNRTDVECRYGRSDVHRCYNYEGRVYASYETAPNTTVYVSTELSGRNEWFSGGWTGNEYRQWAYTELLGPGTGWYRTTGELDIGSGRYPDTT